MVWWPRAADRHFTVFQLLGGGGVAILIFFYRLGIDQVGDVNEHACGSDLLAADFFFQRIEKLVHLHGERPGLSLALALTGSLHPELRQIVAAHGVGKLNVDHGLSQGTVAHDQLNVHFGLPAQPFNTYSESSAVDPNGLSQSVVRVENGPETEGQNCRVTKAAPDHSGA